MELYRNELATFYGDRSVVFIFFCINTPIKAILQSDLQSN
jgi:hypothetical protein